MLSLLSPPQKNVEILFQNINSVYVSLPPSASAPPVVCLVLLHTVLGILCIVIFNVRVVCVYQVGAVFGDKCVCVVSGVPNYAASLDASSSVRQRGRRNNSNMDCNVEGGNGRYAWFRSVVRLPRLRDRVWDARLIHGGETEFQREGGIDKRNGGHTKKLLVGDRRSGDVEQDLVAVALAYNTVEVCMGNILHKQCV